MENDNTVLLNPPLFALDKDAPLHYAGNKQRQNQPQTFREIKKRRGMYTREKCDDLSAEHAQKQEENRSD